MTVAGNAVDMPTSQSFSGNAALSSGSNSISVSATAGGGSGTTTNTHKLEVVGAGSQTLTYDDNGNLTSDGTNSFAWDAENRLIQITYPSSGNNSAFTYDPFGRMVKIVETVASSVTSTKQHIWCNGQRCEERDGSGNSSKLFFARGQINGSTNYFYGRDHLRSVRTITDDNADEQAVYSFDPFGRQTKLEGGQESDFQFAGYYVHLRSGLNFTRTRAYSGNIGRFINRDPIQERGGINQFAYVNNAPVRWRDPSGKAMLTRELSVLDVLMWIMRQLNGSGNDSPNPLPPTPEPPNPNPPHCDDDDDDDDDEMGPPMSPTEGQTPSIGGGGPPPPNDPPDEEPKEEEEEDECAKCLTTFHDCKSDCIQKYPKGGKRNDCISDCKADLLRCQEEHCK